MDIFESHYIFFEDTIINGLNSSLLHDCALIHLPSTVGTFLMQ